MDNDNKLPVRKRNRLKDYDYGSIGAYFVTICTKDRKNIFWEKGPSGFVGEDDILPYKYFDGCWADETLRVKKGWHANLAKVFS